MIPFEETIKTKQELIEACKKGFEDYSNKLISKNDFCMFFGFTHGEAITKFYEGNYEKLLLDGGFNSGSIAYFSGGINAWKNLRDGKYEFPPFIQEKKDKSIEINLHLQQIFYGAPGTGKSHKVNETTEKQPKENVFRTTFHPDSDYSTFVGCYKPTMTEKPVRNVAGDVVKKSDKDVVEKVITYAFTPQAFTKAYVRAWQTTEPVFLVIEEINRGNCAQIFGDLFQLLDRNNGVSEYPVDADTDLANFIHAELADSDYPNIPDEVKNGKKLLLPANLYIWATMNTSDQSLFPIDSAFKRRWEWKYVPIDTKKEEWHILVNGHKYSWTSFLDIINDEVLTDETAEDKHLGFYFCKAENRIISAEKLVGKVLFYLWNDVFKVYGVPSRVTNGSKDMTYPKFYNTDGTVNEDMVEQLLDNLGVARVEPDGEDGPTEPDDNA